MYGYINIKYTKSKINTRINVLYNMYNKIIFRDGKFWIFRNFLQTFDPEHIVFLEFDYGIIKYSVI